MQLLDFVCVRGTMKHRGMSFQVIQTIDKRWLWKVDFGFAPPRQGTSLHRAAAIRNAHRIIDDWRRARPFRCDQDEREDVPPAEQALPNSSG